VANETAVERPTRPVAILLNGRQFRLLNVLGDFNREGLGIEVDEQPNIGGGTTPAQKLKMAARILLRSPVENGDYRWCRQASCPR